MATLKKMVYQYNFPDTIFYNLCCYYIAKLHIVNNVYIDNKIQY